MKTPLTTVVQDHGLYDNIQRVIFGAGLKFWLHRLLFLDALSYLSHGQLSLSLDRMLLVDIDDIFVGEVGTRLKPDDVRALLSTQIRMQSMVPGFKFNLGFSGKYYHHGDREEDKGDDLILENVDKFMWFSHMWNHQQPHLYDNLTQLIEDMSLNRQFAKEKGQLVLLDLVFNKILFNAMIFLNMYNKIPSLAYNFLNCKVQLKLLIFDWKSFQLVKFLSYLV